MKIIQNKFKADLSKDKIQYGIFNGIADSYAAEIAAGAGFDWVLIDGEHAPFDLRKIIHQMQAMSIHETPVFVRPPNGDPVIVKQLLDAGVQNLLIPMVESKQQTELMVRSIQYPPKGIRGVGTALARAAQWNRVENYFHEADEQMCLFVQVESVTGYDALDEILEVENLDGVFIGPADLAASMGLIGQPMHPIVIEKVQAGIKKIRAAGKYAGTLAVKDDVIKKYQEAGTNMMGLGVDLILLAKATAALASKYTNQIQFDSPNY